MIKYNTDINVLFFLIQASAMLNNVFKRALDPGRKGFNVLPPPPHLKILDLSLSRATVSSLKKFVCDIKNI